MEKQQDSNPILITKIGGNVLDDEDETIRFLEQFIKHPQPKVLIHGGGKIATDVSARMGIETKMIDGRRITDLETLRVTTMVYAGWTNKTLVAHLQSMGIDALGISGVDLNLIQAIKRPVKEIDYGWVGDVSGVNIPRWSFLIDQGILPVLCAITHDMKGHLLNTNADTMAAEVAMALSEKYAVQLVYCFEKRGVMLDQNDESSVIKCLTREDFDTYKQSGVISKGMIPKLENAFKASAKGIKDVYICAAQDIGQFLSSGTQICQSLSPNSIN
jgi:acetylglutamate kinase